MVIVVVVRVCTVPAVGCRPGVLSKILYSSKSE